MGKSIATFAIVLSLLAGAWAAVNEHVLESLGGSGPGYPIGTNLIWGNAGIIYGQTTQGGVSSACEGGCGAVFTFTPKTGTVVIHSFGLAADDGAYPTGRLLLDKKGNLFGVAEMGGNNNTGMVFELSPQSNGSWNESILYGFGPQGGNDGVFPNTGLIMDAAGNLYGTTTQGGAANDGVIFELSPKSNGNWQESILYAFSGNDGIAPNTLILDQSGDVYGSTGTGGNLSCDAPYGCGTVFQLARSNNQWQVKTIYSFDGTHGQGVTGAIRDASGNLYGTTSGGGLNDTGTIWELVYSSSQKTYAIDLLHNFGTLATGDGTYPLGGLTFGPNGSLYGTTLDGGSSTCGWQAGCGTVYRLVKNANTWTKESFELANENTDGYLIYGNVIEDQNGNAYGMTTFGGLAGGGVLFEVGR